MLLKLTKLATAAVVAFTMQVGSATAQDFDTMLCSQWNTWDNGQQLAMLAQLSSDHSAMATGTKMTSDEVVKAVNAGCMGNSDGTIYAVWSAAHE